MAQLPVAGVNLQVQNGQQAINQLNAFNKALGGIGNAGGGSTVFSRLNKEISSTFQNIGKGLPGFGKLTSVIGATSAQSAQLATALGGATVALGAIAAASVGATVAFAGFVALGKRGLGIENTAKAFGNSVASFGNATTVLQKLREQTRGTVSDVDLMRLSIVSLQGTSNDFRKVVAPNLGKIFDVTARAAKATGQSADIVREKFLMGLRRQSKLLLDDIGVMVNAEQAQKKYAESIGKTVGALTDLDKQAAFAQEAISQLDRIGQEAGGGGFSDILARSTAVFKNIVDKLSVAILPAFKPILGQFNVLLDVVESISNFAIPVLQTLAQVVGSVITSAFNVAGTVISTFFGSIGNGAGKTLPYAIALFQIFADVAMAAIKQIENTTQKAIMNFGSLVNFFLKPLGKVGEFISNLFKGTNDQFNNGFEQLAFNVGRGGANIVGAFAAGLLRGGTKVAEAAAKIAQIVADFLVGFSPPKKGALANIDQGAANIAKAFAEGFTGGILPPVEQVAADIDRRLGVIGTFSLEQVAAAFGSLNLAIRPFTEQLQLAKADLEAIAGFIDPAIKIAERQRKNLLKAFGKGESADIDVLRFQDAQIERFKELKDVETDRVDQAELQLGLVNAAQSSERALLAIQQARLGTVEKIKEEELKEEKVKEEKIKEEKALKGGGGAAAEPTPGEGGGFTPGEAPDLLSNAAVDNAKKQILAFGSGIAGAASQGISQGLAESGFNSALAQFQGATGNVKSQLARAASANPAQKILDKFSGLKTGIADTLAPFQEEFDRIFAALFGEDGSISGFISRFTTNISDAITADGSPFQVAKNAIIDAFDAIKEIVDDIDFTPFKTELTTTFGIDSPDSPISQLTLALDNAGKLFNTFKETVSNVFDSLFGKEGTVLQWITDFDTALINTMDNLFKEGGVIETAMGNLQRFVDAAVNFVVEKFNLLTGDGEGSIKYALSSLASVLSSALLVPVVEALNSVFQSVEDGFNKAIHAFNDLPLGIDIPDIFIDRLELPGAATGAMGIKGSFIAGEKGAELITTKRPVNVFPASATRALADIAARPMPMYGGYGDTNSYSNSSNFNQSNTINVNSPNQALLMERQLRARMR